MNSVFSYLSRFLSQHHTWPGAVAMCVVGGRVARGGLARPRRAAWACSRSTRQKVDSLAMYTPSSASHLLALGLAQGVSRARPYGLRPAISGNKTRPRLPSLQCSHIDPGGLHPISEQLQLHQHRRTPSASTSNFISRN